MAPHLQPVRQKLSFVAPVHYGNKWRKAAIVTTCHLALRMPEADSDAVWEFARDIIERRDTGSTTLTACMFAIDFCLQRA